MMKLPCVAPEVRVNTVPWSADIGQFLAVLLWRKVASDHCKAWAECAVLCDTAPAA